MKALAIALIVSIIMVATAAYSDYDDPNSFAVEEAPGKPVVVYSTDQLRAEFTNVIVETKTPWNSEVIRWRGPLLFEVLHAGGLNKLSSVQIAAYDDFLSEIKLDEIRQYKPILAIERSCTDADVSQGKCQTAQEFRPIDLNEKGPHFIVWPIDKLPSSYVPARNSIWVFFPVAARPAPR
jgi:hypothetical protein